MPRLYSRRAALGVLGAGLAGLTGAVAPRTCDAFSGSDGCPARVSLSGPETVSLSVDATDPRFVLANAGGDAVRVAGATWTVYRRENGWTHVASDPSGGAAVTIAPGDETAWALLVRGGEGATTTSTTTDATSLSTTRYVGPVSLSPGAHAFVLSGTADGDRFEVAARFDARQ